MAKNDFKAFATGENANTLSQEEYENADFIEEGFKSGIARSERLNKVWRQSSIIAAVIGKYIAEKTGEDVIDDGDLEKLTQQLDLALKQKITTEIPAASLTQKGISQLNSATNSDREDQAATPKAVHDVRKIAEGKLSGVPDASLTQKGIVQLSNQVADAGNTVPTSSLMHAVWNELNKSIDGANTNATNANNNATSANNNANNRLAKNQNGADIPNKSEFIKNLGLAETVALAKNAFPKSGGVVNGNVDATGYVKSGDGADVVSSQDIWAKRYIYESGLRVYSPNNKPTAGDVGAYTKGESDGRYQPHGNYQSAGNYAVRGECYTRGESDNRYLQTKVTNWKPLYNGGDLPWDGVNIDEDIRGKIIWVQANDQWNSFCMPPVDDMPMWCGHSDNNWCAIKTSNNGKRIHRAAGKGNTSIRQVYVAR
ncbi:tail fiber protein [Photorhabdus cinerea]|uniref:Phage tail protein n=1 Tax=Photorhabdus cinerea TaxID=471575 RepID=A0A7X5TI93_9GAMM|nr:phage tail protein [Photorhabdus cinerea]NHB93620.1 hypothetical protein [Photorhabdus cinerea]